MDAYKDGIAFAFVRAQAEIESAIKDKKNPAFRSTYADLASVIDAVKPALAKHNLGFIQEVTEREHGGVFVETVIIHASGETIRTGRLPVPVSKADAHGYGSAITYGKRYSLMAAFGVPAEDDDGNAASARQEPQDDARTKAIRKVADKCIALHAVAVRKKESESDNSGFWALHDEAARVQGEDRLLLWEMLRDHSAVRSALKEYGSLAREQAGKAVAS